MTAKKKANTRKAAARSLDQESASELIDAGIRKLADWRGNALARFRALIKRADPDVIEEVKWRKPSNSMLGVPVWSHDGIICTGETYRDKVKLTFARGASLEDPAGLFNASLEGNTRRAIDVREGDRRRRDGVPVPRPRRSGPERRLGEAAAKVKDGHRRPSADRPRRSEPRGPANGALGRPDSRARPGRRVDRAPGLLAFPRAQDRIPRSRGRPSP